MQKILSLLFSFLLITLSSTFAQKIKFESTLENARALSLKQGKPLAILITIEPPVVTPDFQKGLSDVSVIEKFNSNFVNYKVARDDTAVSARLIRDYNVYRFPSFLFLDAKGGIMLNELAILSRPEALLTIADKALAFSKEKSLVDYDSEFRSGIMERDFLKSYIEKRKSAGITNNADLIEKYVSLLSIRDLNSYDEILFILKAGPLADSTAYRLAYTNRKIVDSIFRSEPLPVRVAMNNASVTNTLISAIANKNISRAYAAANFSRNTWTTDRLQGEKNWNMKILQYHIGVKDTLSYLRTAAAYYERFYMQISSDSARKRDSMNFEFARMRAANDSRQLTSTQSLNKQRDSSIARNNDSLTKSIKGDTIKRRVSFTFPKDMYATELNNAAWSFYLMAGNNNDFLMKAMLWSRRSLELAQKAAFYDTYAHLLYKLKFYSEAESMQKKAIETGIKEKTDVKIFEKEYNKIKNKTL